MLIETLRSVTDALATGSIGVNAQLASIQRDAGDPVPTSVVLITDQTRNFDLALGKTPTEQGYPMILVTINSPVDLKGEVVGTIRDAEIEVLIRYETQGTETDDLVRDTYYTLRAIERCLNQFHSNANASMRTRNGVHLQECLSMQHSTVETYEQGQQVLANISVKYLVRDTQP